MINSFLNKDMFDKLHALSSEFEAKMKDKFKTPEERKKFEEALKDPRIKEQADKLTEHLNNFSKSWQTR